MLKLLGLDQLLPVYSTIAEATEGAKAPYQNRRLSTARSMTRGVKGGDTTP